MDPRIKRTRRLLQEGLQTALGRKPLDEVLVQDITEAAGVNRATFYDHYTDKYDLFNALIAAGFEAFLTQRKVCFDGDCRDSLAAIVLAVGDFLEQIHRDHSECTRQSSAGTLVDGALTLAIQKIMREGLAKKATPMAAPHEVIAAMVSGSIYGAVKEQMSRNDWKVDEAALLSLTRLIQPLLEQSFQGQAH